MINSTFSQRQYSVSAVLADIGWITEDEKRAVTDITGGSIHHTSDLAQLHLHWHVPATTFNEAMDAARVTLRQAADATGAFCPRTSQMDIREIATP